MFQLEKVLQQGDITEVAEPYMKDEKVNISPAQCLLLSRKFPSLPTKFNEVVNETY